MVLRKLSRSLKFFLAVAVTVFSSGLMPSAVAHAATQPWTEDTNHVEYWQDLGYGTCTKVEEPGGTSYTLPASPSNSTWSLLVVKAGSEYNQVYEDPTVGVAYDAPTNSQGNPRTVSHVIYCQEPTTPTDACPNIEDNQATVPEGMELDENGDCVTPLTDICPNIEDTQVAVPEGMEVDNEGNCITPGQGGDEDRKVFVCKYVGTPGIDERLQPSDQNPISVSISSIEHNQWDGAVPGWFSDAHDRSYVLAYDNGQAEPDVSECPAPEVPVGEADITFTVICIENGVRVTLVNDGDADGTATVNGIDYDVDAGQTVPVDLDYTNGSIGSGTVVIDDVSTPFLKDCTPGQGGNVLGDSTGKTLSTSTVLPATLPATGGANNPFLIIGASLIAYGAAYFLGGRRQLARNPNA
jgi:hypothetical protein